MRATWVLSSAVASNCVLIVVGLLIVPGTLRSLNGVGIIVADLGLQVAIVTMAWWGPLSLRRLGDTADWCLLVGGVFAAAYLGLLLFDFAGQPLPLSPYEFFFAAALASSTRVALRTRRVTRGMLAGAWSLVIGTALWSSGLLLTAYAFWGTRGAHGFWLRDGALAAFRHSGIKDLSVFLLQDLQGALFFHPFLSALIGITCGLVAAALALITTTLHRRLAAHAH